LLLPLQSSHRRRRARRSTHHTLALATMCSGCHLCLTATIETEQHHKQQPAGERATRRTAQLSSAPVQLQRSFRISQPDEPDANGKCTSSKRNAVRVLFA
jgi:hypothetical protein